MDEQLREAIEELNRTLNGLGTTTTDSRGKFVAAADSLFKVKGSGAAAANVLDAMSKSVVKLTSQIYAGEQGQKKYAEAVDEVVTALGMLTFLVGGPFIKALTVLTVGFVKLGKVSTEMADKLFKGYQDLSRSGAAAADGLQGIFQLMQDFRLSHNELGELNRVITETRQGLAMWRGTVYDGAKDMGALRRRVTESGLELEAFGMGMDKLELNEHLSSFINLNARLGTIQGKTVDETVKSLRAYIYETDLLTKITGATRKEQEEAQRKAMQVEQYRAHMMELQAKARAGDKKAAERIDMMNMVMKRYGTVAPQFAEQMAQMATGFIGPGSVGAALLSNSEAFRVMNDQTLSATERMRRLDQALKDSMDPNKGGFGYGLMRFGMFGDTLKMSAAEMADFVQYMGDEDLQKKIERATSVQERQRLLQEKGLSNLAKTLKTDLNSMQSMQELVETGIEPATSAFRTLTEVVESLTSMLPGAKSVEQRKNLATQAEAQKQVKEGRVSPAQMKSDQKEFYDKMYNTLLVEAKKQGVANPEAIARLGAAQSALETGYGKSVAGGQNYFGIKTGILQPGGKVQTTKEYDPTTGQYRNVTARFRKYGSMEESAADYVKFLRENPRYRDVLSAQTAQEAILAQGRSGYATDPQYASKLASIHQGGALAMGGPAFRGRSYLVGERGPELFTPGQSGAVTSNDQLQRAMGAGLDRQIDLASAQVDLSQRMVSVLENQNYTLNKILQAQRS